MENRPSVLYMLIHSRKFWITVVDGLIGLALYFVSKYAPLYQDDIIIIFAAIQPVIAIYIASIAYEDGKRLENGNNHE